MNPARVEPDLLRRIGGTVADVLMLAGVVLAIPFVILGIGLLIALPAKLLLWSLRLL